MPSSKFATVKWLDAVFNREEDPGDMSVVTDNGWIVREDEDSLVIATERHEIGNETSFRDFTLIPKVCIQSITRRRLKGL